MSDIILAGPGSAAFAVFPDNVTSHFAIYDYRNGVEVFTRHPEHLQDLIAVLNGFSLPVAELRKPGGSKHPVTSSFGDKMSRQGWREQRLSDVFGTTHRFDFYKYPVIGETQFFTDNGASRDAAGFRCAFAGGHAEVGWHVSRTRKLTRALTALSDSKRRYSPSDTHFEGVLEALARGDAGDCPLVLFGMLPALIDHAPAESDEYFQIG